MSFKEGTVEFQIKMDMNPYWLKSGTIYKFFDGKIGDVRIKIIKTPDMKLYVEHYHPLTYIRTISYDITYLSEKDHHLALTWSEKEMILYIDGELAARIESKSINEFNKERRLMSCNR